MWSADGAHLFSADGAGVIKRWELLGTQGARGGELRCVATIEKAELLGAPINSLSLHPTRQRLLIATCMSKLKKRMRAVSADWRSGCPVRASVWLSSMRGGERRRWLIWLPPKRQPLERLAPPRC